MRIRWRAVLYQSGIFAGLFAVLGVVAKTVAGFFLNPNWGTPEMHRFYGELAAIAGGAIAFHGAYYLWWAWQLARLTRELGSTSAHEHALSELLSLGKKSVPILVRALSAPAFQWRGGGGKVAWDMDIVRRLAAEGLGRLKQKEAVDGLVEALEDPEVGLRAKILWALGEIGDRQAIPALVPFLGDDAKVTDERLRAEDATLRQAIERTLAGVVKDTLRELAQEALAKLGESRLADAFSKALRGDVAGLEYLRTRDRRTIVEALVRALDSSSMAIASNAAWALAELNAVEALRPLRSKTGLFSGAESEVKEACEQAIARLEALASLPRGVEERVQEVDTLPRAAESQQEHGRETLPRQAIEGLRTED